MVKNHFTATGIVFNSKNEVLMIHHNKLKVWLPPGGHIDENELPDDAVLREIFEETGIEAALIPNKRNLDLSYELTLPFVVLLEDIESDGTHNHIDMIFLCKALSEELKPQKSEVNGIGWFAFEQIRQLDTFDNVIKTIAKAIEHLNDNPVDNRGT